MTFVLNASFMPCSLFFLQHCHIPCFFSVLCLSVEATKEWGWHCNIWWEGEKQFLHKKVQVNRDDPKGRNKFPASGNVKSLLDGPGFICTFFTWQSGTFLSSMILFIAHLECNFLKCLDKRPCSRWGALREDTEQNEKVREEGTGGRSL